MTLLQDDSIYFPNTQIKPHLDDLSSAVQKARINSRTNWFAEPLHASHDGGRADIRSGSLWVELLRALHASRRQAAVRELSKYRHLVQDVQLLDVSSPGAVPEPSAPDSKGSWTSGLGLALLLLACFVMIHAIAIVRIESATHLHSLSSSAPPLELGD
jgi:hypothetical protein